MDIAFCLDINCGLCIWTKDSLLCDCFELFMLSSAGLRFFWIKVLILQGQHTEQCGKFAERLKIP